ncbi:hypothetical protein GYMLUDRAFT_77269 [Collybiopsis luxurians FD-317 M1]|uniref:Uncharacterized protein n=1 Tax=Collybiopsis luxurians FD-317 M1 TaxID=944289 RepID=A0A0D0BWM3_9AGAR|nr:hypothetical protein GYMLUDRAFT_77269 [Collybiopsis luxurians FD-317 M1]
MESCSIAVSNNEVADQIGSSAYFDVVYVLATALFYGLSLPIFVVSIKVLRYRARNSKTVRFLLLLTNFTLFTVTGQFISNVGETLTGLSWSQSPSNSISYLDRMATSNLKAQPYGIASLTFQVLNFFAGDAIVVWRASVLWSNSRAVRYVLCLLLTGSAATSIYDVTNFAIILTRNKGASGNGFLKVDAASMFVSLTVNLAATSCIMIKAGLFRQSIKDTISRDKVSRNVPFQILLSLVECGLFYCAAQVANGVLTILTSVGSAPSQFGRAIVSQFTEFFAGTYSALVVSVIASQQSILEKSSVLDGSSREPAARDIEKASPPRQSTIRFAPGSNLLGGTKDRVLRVPAANLEEYDSGVDTLTSTISECPSMFDRRSELNIEAM